MSPGDSPTSRDDRGGLTRITFLGDTLIGGEAQQLLDEKGPGWAFDGIRHLLGSSDLVVANHEGPITRRDRPETKLETGRKRYWYRAAPECVHALVEAGIRVVSLGNNHILDFGAAGLADTMSALDAAGIMHCGAGSNRSEARRPAIVDVNGLRLGFLSFMQRYDLYVTERLYASRARAGPLRLHVDRARADLARLEGQVDVRVALVHWGRNYRRLNPRQRRLGAELAAAGADIVIGHHPHIPQRIMLNEGVPVCFSLGNGPLGTPGRYHSGRPPYGLVVSFDLDRLAVARRMAVTLIEVDNAEVHFQPRVAEGTEAERVLRKLVPKHLQWRVEPGQGLVADLDRSAAPIVGDSVAAD
jgi:poly-gamma-glutamate capsule biosynthesis protein CapA/YwtB (metallophosphatase superfamily)